MSRQAASHKFYTLELCPCGRTDKLHKSGLCYECERARKYRQEAETRKARSQARLQPDRLKSAVLDAS